MLSIQPGLVVGGVLCFCQAAGQLQVAPQGHLDPGSLGALCSGLLRCRAFRGRFPSLQKPLPLVTEGTAALAERLTFFTLQHAVFIYPQFQWVAAGRKAVAVQGMHSRRKILAAQQLGAAVDIYSGIAVDLNHYGCGITVDAVIDIGFGGTDP
ncbi:hypothetical protein D3C75_1022710 [compost metagenome]